MHFGALLIKVRTDDTLCIAITRRLTKRKRLIRCIEIVNANILSIIEFSGREI